MAKPKVILETKMKVTQRQMKPAAMFLSAVSAYLNGEELEKGMGIMNKTDVEYYLKKLIQIHENSLSRFGL